MDFLDFLAFGIWEKEITMSIIGHDCFYSMYLGGEMRQNGKDPIKRKKEKKKNKTINIRPGSYITSPLMKNNGSPMQSTS